MSFKLILALLAVIVSLPQLSDIASRASGVDEIVYERIACQKKILHAMNDVLINKVQTVESQSGFDITRWCDGLRHTPSNIRAEISNGHIDQAHQYLTYAFSRTEAVRRSLQNPVFLKTPPQQKFEALLELARKPGVVADTEIRSMLEPYTRALERVHNTRRAEDFETELAILSQLKGKVKVASLADQSATSTP